MTEPLVFDIAKEIFKEKYSNSLIKGFVASEKPVYNLHRLYVVE